MEEEITFFTPTFKNNIFVYNVDPKDVDALIEIFQNFGLLYKTKLLDNNLLQIWFYSKNELNRVFQTFRNRYVTVNGKNYYISKVQYPFTDNKKPLKLNEMLNVCNHFIGFGNWKSELKVKINREATENKNVLDKERKIEIEVPKYYAECIAMTKVTIPKFPLIEVYGKGKSRTGGYDRADVIKNATKFAVACSKKSLFKKLIIMIHKNGQIEPKVIKDIGYGFFNEENNEDMEFLDFDEDDSDTNDDENKDIKKDVTKSVDEDDVSEAEEDQQAESEIEEIQSEDELVTDAEDLVNSERSEMSEDRIIDA